MPWRLPSLIPTWSTVERESKTITVDCMQMPNREKRGITSSTFLWPQVLLCFFLDKAAAWSQLFPNYHSHLHTTIPFIPHCASQPNQLQLLVRPPKKQDSLPNAHTRSTHHLLLPFWRAPVYISPFCLTKGTPSLLSLGTRTTSTVCPPSESLPTLFNAFPTKPPALSAPRAAAPRPARPLHSPIYPHHHIVLSTQQAQQPRPDSTRPASLHATAYFITRRRAANWTFISLVLPPTEHPSCEGPTAQLQPLRKTHHRQRQPRGPSLVPLTKKPLEKAHRPARRESRTRAPPTEQREERNRERGGRCQPWHVIRRRALWIGNLTA